MTTYRVLWEIDIDADTPREAAAKARAIQLDPESIATCFETVSNDLGERVFIDLLDEESDSLMLAEGIRL